MCTSVVSSCAAHTRFLLLGLTMVTFGKLQTWKPPLRFIMWSDVRRLQQAHTWAASTCPCTSHVAGHTDLHIAGSWWCMCPVNGWWCRCFMHIQFRYKIIKSPMHTSQGFGDACIKWMRVMQMWTYTFIMLLWSCKIYHACISKSWWCMCELNGSDASVDIYIYKFDIKL